MTGEYVKRGGRRERILIKIEKYAVYTILIHSIKFFRR